MENLEQQLQKFYNEMEGNTMGGLLIFDYEHKWFVRISYGTGDNLLEEDIEEGFDDYLYITMDKFDNEEWIEDVDGGQMMLKMSEEWDGHYNICQHIKDALEMHDISTDNVIVLQSFNH